MWHFRFNLSSRAARRKARNRHTHNAATYAPPITDTVTVVKFSCSPFLVLGTRLPPRGNSLVLYSNSFLALIRGSRSAQTGGPYATGTDGAHH